MTDKPATIFVRFQAEGFHQCTDAPMQRGYLAHGYSR